MSNDYLDLTQFNTAGRLYIDEQGFFRYRSERVAPYRIWHDIDEPKVYPWFFKFKLWLYVKSTKHIYEKHIIEYKKYLEAIDNEKRINKIMSGGDNE